MAQVINTNLASLNSQRNLTTSQASLSTSLQRLSSGLRINSAKDDAAGLAISERFTSQIRGNTTAARNANDGISLAQTAEGGLSTAGDLLQRIRELAVQSANGTNSDSDRKSIQGEVSALSQELNRVANTTQFNGQNVLDGSLTASQFQVGANANQTINVGVQSAKATDIGNNLAVACAGSGYQGYSGPAWRAQAMVSLLTAFRSNESVRSADEHEVPLENEALNSINNNADEINRDLRRVVWNGQLMASTQHGSSRRLKAMLNQVNQASRRTRDRVGVAIKDLHRTSLTRARRQVVDLARLAADIMDRNLYERANDCRWWALSPALQRALAVPADEADPTSLNAVLDHINGLYTVYTRLVAFDTSGRIRGVSHSEDGQNLVGRTVDARWVDASRGLHDSQRYHVSPFEETPLHDQGSTYVYLAAVRGDEASHPWLGGIAIVFNAARELQAMLKDVMADRPGVAAFFDSHGLALASTDPDLSAGLAADLVGSEGLVVHKGVHYACARVKAGGYREFKTSDGYDNGVFALVGLRLGAAERRQSAYSDRPLSSRHAGAHAIEVAIFQVGPMRCALPTASLLEAVTPRGLVRVPLSMAPAIGLLEVLVEGQRQLVQVNCARAQLGVTYRPRSGDGVVLILRPAHDPSQLMGLWIDDVLAVLEVDRSLVHEAPPGFQAFMPWLLGVIDLEAQGAAGPEKVLVQLFDAARITGSATLDEALAHDIEAGLPTQHDTLEELLPTGAAP